MSDEQKAAELIERFRDVTQEWDEVNCEWTDNIDKAKEAATIHCDLMIEYLKEGFWWDEIDNYERIKKAINNE